MSAASKAVAVLAALTFLVPLATSVQAKPKKSERAMHTSKGAMPSKSERAMPREGAAAGSPRASGERAMPAPGKM